MKTEFVAFPAPTSQVSPCAVAKKPLKVTGHAEHAAYAIATGNGFIATDFPNSPLSGVRRVFAKL
jgi:hypothetical protein